MGDPTLLFLDEPTSGLDSKTALHLLAGLKQLAMTDNRVLVASIHQPSSQMFAFIDKLLLLSQGKVL